MSHSYHTRFSPLIVAGLLALAASTAGAQTDKLTVDRIFRGEFRTQPFPSFHWLADGNSYLDATETGIARIDIRTGQSTVLLPASALVDRNNRPIEAEEITLSEDGTKALVFHNSQRVWRQNTRGQYTLVDFTTKQVRPVSTNLAPTMMFAKFSPDAKQVAFVRDHNIYVVDLATGAERALTTDGNANIINGTSDWVYEEEFDLRDGFRWSPDGKRIAFFRFDQSAIPLWTMVDETTAYPETFAFKYPKVGAPNSTVRIGVVDLAGGATRWMTTGADTTVYLPRLEWAGPDSVTIQRLPRKQNKVDFLMASATDGGSRVILTDTDSAYVDVQDPHWLKNGTQFIWMSDRSGWRQYYLYDRSGKVVRQITKDGSDVTELVGVDATNGYLYVQQALPEAHQRQIVRYSLNGKESKQLTEQAGVHSWEMNESARFVAATRSSIGTPPQMVLYELPTMRVVRNVGDNAQLAGKLKALGIRTPELIKVPAADGTTQLDGYRVLPSNFDPNKKYPVMMFAYGGPAAPQVLDNWGGSRYLFNQMLAQNGYVVVVVDNRGSAWRGRNFRKMTQYRLGILESDDQIAVAKWIGQQPWGDASRIGMWGWSYGGYLTAMTLLRGGNAFRMGISVAPVTDWRYYDSAYTERFMWIPTENAEGYQKTSALTYASGLTARYLIVHGTGDDNVHAQNSLALAAKLQLERKPFNMMFYPNKTHSISGPGGTLHLYDMLWRYIQENL